MSLSYCCVCIDVLHALCVCVCMYVCTYVNKTLQFKSAIIIYIYVNIDKNIQSGNTKMISRISRQTQKHENC